MTRLAVVTHIKHQFVQILSVIFTQVKTHVISSIIHIAHEYDDEDKPWPIEIEDHDGNLHAVSLAAGEVFG